MRLYGRKVRDGGFRNEEAPPKSIYKAPIQPNLNIRTTKLSNVYYLMLVYCASLSHFIALLVSPRSHFNVSFHAIYIKIYHLQPSKRKIKPITHKGN